MCSFILQHTPKSKKTKNCTEDELYQTGLKYYNITKDSINSFNDTLLMAYTKQITDIINAPNYKELNIYKIKVNWIKKYISCQWDNNIKTRKIFYF